ncbi:TonB-dependent receptor [Burkholderia plantarii]|uniref:TonB-dependent receptor n=1 Tax=Burkholderia plantarii TaxID=41899 RepID=UPI00272A6719|nr:TonB-dependent receptor [Burkholderia plantarii]WLE63515.1 TonB-dependent receptor [Burkholderia plantarii]
MTTLTPISRAVLLAALALASLPARAAAPGVALGGTVTDTAGAPVDAAEVVLTDAAGHQVARLATDPAGRFTAAPVTPGTYSLSVSSPGFAAVTRTVSPAAGHPAEIAVTLPVDVTAQNVPTISVTARRLDAARNGLLPETGSSIYRITSKDIEAMPQGADTPLNRVLLQAPGVANDSYGQLHVRGDHADLQYRINGILIPEPISGFGQSLDTRIIDQVNLLTGALPAEYGYRTAGIVDIRTKSGDALGNGGAIDVYGGSHQTLKTSADVYGNQGNLSYFFTGSLGVNNLGIEAPTSSADPLHDHTRQGDAFGYLSYVIDPRTRVSLMFGTTANQFEIPNTPGLTPNFTLAGTPAFDSANLDETQSELNNFAVIALQGTNGAALDYQVAFFTRYTRTQFNPDPIDDLIYNGVASQDFHSDTAYGLQADTTYRLGDHHTLRAGLFLQQEHAQFRDSVSVFPTDADGNQASDVPFPIASASSKTGYLYSAYLQDEWKLDSRLTVNYGVRYDGMDQYVTANQLSPRVGLVFKATETTTLHAGYSRYFTPPSFELVSNSTIGAYTGTTNQSAVTQNSAVQPERDDYFDLGVIQEVGAMTFGLDAYYKKAHNLLDLGQFGSALIYTPFNYQYGRVYGVEFTANYKHENVSAYLNVAFSRAMGKNVNSAQFNFDPDELAYISNHWVNLDHDQRVTISFGGAFSWRRTTFSFDGIVGSGLREGFANTGKLPVYEQVDLSVVQHLDLPWLGKADGRLVLVNAFGSNYALRDGSGIGVFAPQYGPTRAVYAGVTKYF